MDTTIVNVGLDLILIVAALWMVMTVRGVGGVVGRTLNFIVIGTVILGVAHLQATFTADLFGDLNGTIHRVVVLVGFLFLVIGFRQLQQMK